MNEQYLESPPPEYEDFSNPTAFDQIISPFFYNNEKQFGLNSSIISSLPPETQEKIVAEAFIEPLKYNGLRDPEMFLSEYEMIAEYNKWDDAAKLKYVIDYLEGAPSTWFIYKVINDTYFNWNTFSYGLIIKFRKSDQHNVDLRIITDYMQKRNQSLNEYWFSKLQLIKLVSPLMAEPDIIVHLLDGLNEHLRFEVWDKVFFQPCETIDEMYHLVKKIDNPELLKDSSETSLQTYNSNHICQGNQENVDNYDLYNELEALKKLINEIS